MQHVNYPLCFPPLRSSRSAPSSPNHVGMSGLMTPESLSRESSPAPNVSEQITLHAAPVDGGGGGGGEAPQLIGSHLEVKTTTFTPSQREDLSLSLPFFFKSRESHCCNVLNGT